MVELSGGKGLEKALVELAKKLTTASEVSIGFLADATYHDGKPVAMVAALNEFGHEDVPPRPFFRGMIQDKSPEWPEAVGDLLIANGYDGQRTLEQTGAAIKGQLQEAITVYVGPGLAESTIERKGHDKELIDTGTLLRSVDYAVR